MEEAASERWTNYWCDPGGISIDRGRLVIRAAPLQCIRERSSTGVCFGQAQQHDLEEFDSVHVRIDPPISLDYLQTLQLLDFGRSRQYRRRTTFVNPLEALLGSTSKLEPLRVSDVSPATLISRDWSALCQFGRSCKRTVLKPVHSSQSAGVVHLDWQTASNRDRAREAIETLSNGLSAPVVLQEDLSDDGNNEIRVWLLDGARLAWAVKAFRASTDPVELRNTKLTPRQLKTLSSLQQHLRRRGIRLAAADMIGDVIVDLNYASPGMLLELEHLTGQNLAHRVIVALTPHS
jgi:glutathione synthase